MDIDLETYQQSEQEAMSNPQMARQIFHEENMASRMRRQPVQEMPWTKEQVKQILKDQMAMESQMNQRLARMNSMNPNEASVFFMIERTKV